MTERCAATLSESLDTRVRMPGVVGQRRFRTAYSTGDHTNRQQNDVDGVATSAQLWLAYKLQRTRMPKALLLGGLVRAVCANDRAAT